MFNEHCNKTDNIEIFSIATALEMFLNPLHYSWQELKYGLYTDFMDEGDSLFPYMMFDSDLKKNIQKVKDCLEEQSPFASVEKNGMITNSLIAIYDDILIKLIK